MHKTLYVNIVMLYTELVTRLQLKLSLIDTKTLQHLSVI